MGEEKSREKNGRQTGCGVSIAPPGHPPWGFVQTISCFLGDAYFGLHRVSPGGFLHAPHKVRGLKRLPPAAPKLPSSPRLSVPLGAPATPSHPVGPGGMSPSHLHGARVWGSGRCEEQQGVCKTPSTEGCKTVHRFAKMGHVLGRARAHVPHAPIRARYRWLMCPAPQFGQGTTAAWPWSWELSPRQHGLGSSLQGLSKQPSTPKNPGGDVGGRGVTPEGCGKFSIYRDGDGRGWSPAIFYSRCIPKILLKCNIKL